MARVFRKGEHVAWHSRGSEATGEVAEKITRPPLK